MSEARIAAIEYPSGRLIYLGERPEIGEFYPQEQRFRAFHFPTEQAAQAALRRLLAYFEITDPSPLKLRTLAPQPRKQTTTP